MCTCRWTNESLAPVVMVGGDSSADLSSGTAAQPRLDAGRPSWGRTPDYATTDASLAGRADSPEDGTATRPGLSARRSTLTVCVVTGWRSSSMRATRSAPTRSSPARNGRRVEIETGRGIVTVSEVTRTGTPVRTARFMASRILALVEHPAADQNIARQIPEPSPADSSARGRPEEETHAGASTWSGRRSTSKTPGRRPRWQDAPAVLVRARTALQRPDVRGPGGPPGASGWTAA